jgi:two-component sensor histidine kinase
VTEPTSHSFGTRLLKAVVPGDTNLEFRPGGVTCEIRIPLDKLKN